MLNIEALAVVRERGRIPPVRSLAWTETSGLMSRLRPCLLVFASLALRNEEDEGRPRRKSPVKTSSAIKGRPDQFVGSSSDGDGDGVEDV